MRLPRRSWLKWGGALAAGAVLPLPLLFRHRGGQRSRLVSDRAGLLDLAPGLTYRVVDRALEPMSDGYRVPARPDGMGCFEGPAGTLVLMRNHELDHNRHLGAWREAPPEAFDPSCHGGVTRVVLERRTLERRASNLVLTGTLRNCAGGASPWGWLSCEETVSRGHGWVFLCATNAGRVAPPRRIPAYGRFNHEAACVDPATHIAYLTEDRADGCLYRFVPRDRGRPFEGALQALAVPGSPRRVTSDGLRIGARLAVDWVDVPDPAPDSDTVREQAQERGAAIVRRGEGMFFHQGKVYFVATSGGPAGAGQVFRLDLATGVLELMAQSEDGEELDGPDNVTVAPWGDIVVAEDGSGDQYVRGITPSGRIYDIARNARSGGEFAGVCFAPDGAALFFNLQNEGITVAVSGALAELRSRV